LAACAAWVLVSALKSVDCTGAPCQAVNSRSCLHHSLSIKLWRTLPTLGIPTIPHDRERPPGKEARSARTFACEDMRRIHARHAGFTRAFESEDMRSGWYPVGCNVFSRHARRRYCGSPPPQHRAPGWVAAQGRGGARTDWWRPVPRRLRCGTTYFCFAAEENRSGVCMCMCDFHACCVHLCVCEMCVNVHVC
jgi:hypothetical protein